MVGGVAAVDEDAAVEGAAGEVRDESVDGAEEGGLADAGVADDQAQFAFLDGEVHVAQDRFGRVLVLDGDLVEVDHLGSSVRWAGTVGRAAGGAGGAGCAGCAGGAGGGARNPAVPASRMAAAGTRGRVGQLRG